MSEHTKLTPDHVRAVFQAASGELGHKQIYAALADMRVEITAESREHVGNVLRYLVRWDYLQKSTEGGVTRFARTGKEKGRRDLLSPAESTRRRRERERLRRIRNVEAKPPRERRMDGNTVSRPKAVKEPAFSGKTETIAEFEARGGMVQRLTTHWEEAECAA